MLLVKFGENFFDITISRVWFPLFFSNISSHWLNPSQGKCEDVDCGEGGSCEEETGFLLTCNSIWSYVKIFRNLYLWRRLLPQGWCVQKENLRRASPRRLRGRHYMWMERQWTEGWLYLQCTDLRRRLLRWRADLRWSKRRDRLSKWPMRRARKDRRGGILRR